MKHIPYGRHCIDEDDINAVIEVLRSDWLTTGPKVEEFEQLFADFVGTKYAVSVSSGTAALHAITYALGIKAGDEVIVPSITFAATANCVVFQGGTPVFADVQHDTLLIDPTDVETKITPRTKAVIAVDYAGQPCDYDTLQKIADRHNIKLIADACHSLGGSYKGKVCGSLADMSAFSFHPVKNMTCGEGGMVTTDDETLARAMRMFRNHGISTDHRKRVEQGTWFYEMIDLGFNYRITDFQCALGISQLKKVPAWIDRRQEIAFRYSDSFAEIPIVQPLSIKPHLSHAYHLYVVRLNSDNIIKAENIRDNIFKYLQKKGVGVNVHYIPVHLHPFYMENFGTGRGLCPVAEKAYDEILSLPIFPAMKDSDVDFVAGSLLEAIK
jgi:perosamine synthetase